MNMKRESFVCRPGTHGDKEFVMAVTVEYADQIEDELRAQIKVYRDALKIAAQRFRTMRHETAAQDIERILETT